MAKVTLKDVNKMFPGGVQAVKDADLEIRDREFVVLVGPSGCGKSTTLRMIAGLEEITSGDIYIGEQRVNDVPPKNRDIAMVFQNYALYPHMTVYNNMAFGLRLRRMSKKEIDGRVREAADILDLSRLLERKPKALSGGQRQRVAVGRAIVRQPKAFLFDEPLSNLDAKLRVQMRAEISKLHTRLAATMIYVTHDQVEAMTMGDKIVVMNDGWIQQVDTPMHIYNRPVNRFVAGFIGSPPMNFVEGHVERSGEALVFKTTQAALRIDASHAGALAPYAGKPCTLGIRPEDLRDALMTAERDPMLQFTARVEVVEPMGAETMLYLTDGSHSFIARMDALTRVKENDEMNLNVNMKKAHFFDPETERALV